MTETAKRTLPWSGGVVEKGKPVPADVPEGYLRDWRKRGWLDGEPPAPPEPAPVEAEPEAAERKRGKGSGSRNG